MANHPITCWIFYNDQWNQIDSDIHQPSGVTLTRGGGEASSSPKPNGIDLTLLDDNGVYQPHHPNSPLYGKTSRNTPLMIGTLVAYEDFEDASIVVTIGSGSSANPWARSTTSPHTGSWCLKSGATADGAFSDAIITVPAGANVCTLWYRTDCSSTDTVQVTTGTLIRVSASGTGGTWQPITVPVMGNTSGVKQVYVRYQKDASGTAGADAVYIDDVTFYAATAAGEASWSPDPGSPGDPAFTEVSAKGLLQRLGSWTDQIQSAYTRYTSILPGLLGFWPGEDAREATAMSNLVPLGSAAAATSVTFEDAESPGGGDTSMRLALDSEVSGAFLAGSETAWTIAWAFRLAKTPDPGPLVPIITWSSSDGKAFTVYVDDTTYNLEIINQDGSVVFLDNVQIFGGNAPNQWVLMRLRMSISAGTVTWEWAWYAEGASGAVGTSGTFAASTIGRPTQWFVNGNTNMDGGWFGYLYAINGVTTDPLSANQRVMFNGFPGETAAARAVRLMFEAGLPLVIRGFGKTTESMGLQRPGTLLSILTGLRDTDGGILCDFEGTTALAYRVRRDLYAQTPALTLTYGVDVAPPLRPVLDDLGTHNYVVVENSGGGSETAIDSTSIMGTAPPPLGAGLNKQTISVNLLGDSRLIDIASWNRALGTNPEPRYPQVTVDLDATPSLEATIEALVPGDRVQINGLMPDVVDLLFVGITDKRADQKRRTATLLCVPYRTYDVAIYTAFGAPLASTQKRYESRTSTLNAGYNTTGTTVVVTFTDVRDAWSTTSVPYDWVVSGERITVTSMGAVTGSGPWTQTATVTRSVNGIVKSHLAGDPVRMHPDQEARYAL